MCIDTCPQNQLLPSQPLHYHGQDRPSGLGYKTISETLGEKVTAVTVITKSGPLRLDLNAKSFPVQ